MAVSQPPGPKSPLSTLGNIASVGLGIYTGGASGALMAGTGGLGLASDTKAPPVEGLQQQASAPPAPITQEPINDANAIQRKLAQQVSIEEQIKIFQTAEQLLPTLPQPVREEIGPPIFDAMVSLANQIKQTGYIPGQGQGIG